MASQHTGGLPEAAGGSSDRSALLAGAAVATIILLVLLLVDIVTASGFFVAPLFALGPMVACAVLPARGTAVFASVAVALTFLSGWWNANWGSAQQLVRILDVALVSSAAVAVAWVRVRREQRFARVVAIAEVAQRAILPVLPAAVGRVTVGARYLSAAQDAVVGGDLYDCYHSSDRARFLIGDVRGKGIAAVEQAARVIRAFRQSAATEVTLAAVADDMNAYLVPFFDDEEFVTALLVDASGPGRLVVVSCGHPSPLLVRADGEASFPEVPVGLPLGLGGEHEACTLDWDSGDRILMYTDGLSEARNAGGDFLPVLALAPLVRTGAVDETLSSLVDAVRRHVPRGNLTDDLAVLLLENGVDEHRRSDSAQDGHESLGQGRSLSATR